MRRPVWFDAECKHKRRVYVEAVRTGQAVHACKHFKKEYKKDQACTACACEAPGASLPGQIVQT